MSSRTGTIELTWTNLHCGRRRQEGPAGRGRHFCGSGNRRLPFFDDICSELRCGRFLFFTSHGAHLNTWSAFKKWCGQHGKLASFNCRNIFHMKATGMDAIIFRVVSPKLCCAIFYHRIGFNQQQHRSGSVFQSGRNIDSCCKKQPKVNDNSRKHNGKSAVPLFSYYDVLRFFTRFFYIINQNQIGRPNCWPCKKSIEVIKWNWYFVIIFCSCCCNATRRVLGIYVYLFYILCWGMSLYLSEKKFSPMSLSGHQQVL